MNNKMVARVFLVMLVVLMSFSVLNAQTNNSDGNACNRGYKIGIKAIY